MKLIVSPAAHLAHWPHRPAWTPVHRPAYTGFRPRVNVVEDAEGYTLQVMAPGRDKNHFRLELNQDELTVRYNHPAGETSGTYTRREFELSDFERSFRLGESIDTTAISATYTDGILHVRLPRKAEAARPVQEIAIA
ncbi:MAG: hypothetical protein OHK0039_37800 [Bacteroidia bacterium]